MKTKRCIRCNHHCPDGDKFCSQCGAHMENRCTNDGGAFREPCNRVNEPQAVYCVSCGAPTIFKQTKLISSPHDEGEKYFSEEHKDLDLFEHSFFRDDS